MKPWMKLPIGAIELPDAPGVYFAQMMGVDYQLSGPVKFGRSTTSMRARVRGFSGMPWPVYPIGWAQGGQAEEQAAMAAMSQYRMNGEWFRSEPNVLDFVLMCSDVGIEAAIRDFRPGRVEKKIEVTKKAKAAEKERAMALYQRWLDGDPEITEEPR